MRLLKLVLGIAGVTLIASGLFALLIPNGSDVIDFVDSSQGHRSSSQYWGMICLGFFALLAVVFAKSRK